MSDFALERSEQPAGLGSEESNNPDILDGKVGNIDIVDDAPSKRTCRKSWAQLIYKVYEVDPLLCPNK